MRGILISIFVIIALILLGGIFWIMVSNNSGVSPVPSSTSDTSESPSNPEDTESHSYKGVSFIRPEGFGLAVNSDQLLVESNIPPCTEGFNYCLYYNGGEYENTNFESAGVGIFEREELQNRDSCLYSPPQGFSNLAPEIKDNEDYGASLFTPIQMSGAGHSSMGEIYRLFASETCFEIETRIGTTQFGIDDEVTKEFSESDRANITGALKNIIENVRLNDDVQETVLTF